MLALVPAAAQAGPPFLTDDPEPTETGRWEVYAPLIEVEGRGSDVDSGAAVELNYGAAPDLQLTLAVPLKVAHDASGWRSGLGDVAVSAKYRQLNDERTSLEVAAFPGLSIPIGTNGTSAGKVNALLPDSLQKDH